MDVHFEKPDLEARIENWVAETGRTREEFIEDAFAGYFEELARVREMLDSRYDDLKNGRIRPIDGDRFFAELRRLEDELPGRKT